MAFIDDFKARFPEFNASVVDERVPIFENVWPSYFTGDYAVVTDREAILNLVAHLITMDQSAGSGGATAAGNIASKSVGNVSVSYNTASDQSSLRDFFGGTKYGMNFLLVTMYRRGAVFV